MIVVQDRIEIAGSGLDHLLRLLHDEYMGAAAKRGLQFIEAQISPPVKLQNAPNTLWLRWQVADAAAWWAMRAQSSTPDVTRFWATVDTLCMSRQRSYHCDDTPEELPQIHDVSDFIVSTRGYRETAQMALKDPIDDAQRTGFENSLQSAAADLPGLELAQLSANFAPEYAAGHYTWDLLFPDRLTAENARQSACWTNVISTLLATYCAHSHALRLETISAGMRRPDLANGIKRTAYFRLLPGTLADTALCFENDLLEMAAQIPQILNWRLSRASTLPWHTADCEPWTYVWEQEFECLDDLLGPYMLHPHHWAHVDRWFDPESGVQAVDVNLSHAFCGLEKSVIQRESL
jgi:hypothetical protein